MVFVSGTTVALRTLNLFQSLSLLLQEMALITFFFRIKQVLIEEKKKNWIWGKGNIMLSTIDVPHSGAGICLLNLAVCIRIAKTFSFLS